MKSNFVVTINLNAIKCTDVMSLGIDVTRVKDKYKTPTPQGLYLPYVGNDSPRTFHYVSLITTRV